MNLLLRNRVSIQPPGMESKINFGNPVTRGLQNLWINLRGNGGSTGRIMDLTGRVHLSGSPLCRMYAWNAPSSGAGVYSIGTRPHMPEVTVLAKVFRIGSGGTHTIAARMNNAATAADWILLFTSANTLQLEVLPGGIIIQSISGFPVNAWHTVGFRRSGSLGNWNVDLLAEGKVIGGVQGFTTNPSTDLLKIGLFAWTNSTKGLQGAIQYCAVWNRRLSVPEVMSVTKNPYQLLSTKSLIPANYSMFNPVWTMASNVLVSTDA